MTCCSAIQDAFAPSRGSVLPKRPAVTPAAIETVGSSRVLCNVTRCMVASTRPSDLARAVRHALSRCTLPRSAVRRAALAAYTRAPLRAQALRPVRVKSRHRGASPLRVTPPFRMTERRSGVGRRRVEGPSSGEGGGQRTPAGLSRTPRVTTHGALVIVGTTIARGRRAEILRVRRRTRHLPVACARPR